MKRVNSKIIQYDTVPKVTIVLDKQLKRIYKSKENKEKHCSKHNKIEEQIVTTTFRNIQQPSTNIENKVVLDFVDYIYKKYPIKDYQKENVRSQSLQQQKLTKQNSNSSLSINAPNKRSISIQKEHSSQKRQNSTIRFSDKKVKYTRVNLKQSYQKTRDPQYYMSKLQSNNKKLQIKHSIRNNTQANQTINETKTHLRVNSTMESTDNQKMNHKYDDQQSKRKIDADKFKTPQRLLFGNQPSRGNLKLQKVNNSVGSFLPYSQIFEENKIQSEIVDNFKRYQRQLSELSEIVHLTSAKKDSFKLQQPSTHLFEQEEQRQQQQNQSFYKKSILDYYPKYRYCFGCQEPVLQQNIKSHQKICQQFINIKKMDFKGIEKALLNKLTRLAEEIRKDSLDFGQVIFRQFSKIEGIKEIQVFEKHYNLITQQTNKIYRYLRNINKYKWFTKLKLHYKEIFTKYDIIA